jgi:hypothetical protein
VSGDPPTRLLARLSTSASASVLLWISRTLLSLLVVYPLLLAIRATGMVSGPEGDAVLFRPDSLLLLELLRVGLASLGSACKVLLLLAALGAIAELLPLAGALDLLCFAERRWSQRMARAIRHLPSFFGLSGLALLAQAAVLLGASLLAGALKAALAEADERLLSVAPVLLLGLGLLACAAVGSVLDVARAIVVERDIGARQALHWALSCLREQPFSVLLGGYSSLAGGALSYLCAAWFLARLDLSRASTVSVALAFAVHQLAVLCAIAWRVRWLGTALTLTGQAQTEISLR